MELTLPQLVKIIRRNVLLIVIFTLACGIVTFVVSKYVVAETYVSTVKLYVSTPTSANANPGTDINALNYAQKVVNTYIEMLQTNSFLQKVQERAGVDMKFDDFRKMVQFHSLNDTEVFQADISAHDPAEAKRIADTISELAPSTIAQFKDGASLKIVDPANYPDKPSSPHPALNTAIGAVIALLASVCWFVLRSSLDLRIMGEEDITEHYNIPVLAAIPAFNKEFVKRKRALPDQKKRG